MFVSLISCIYKVLSKMLANRLKKVIGSIISKTQSAFVYGRQILENILITNEIVYEARKRIKEVVMFKVDFEKTYNFLDWNFLDFVIVAP